MDVTRIPIRLEGTEEKIKDGVKKVLSVVRPEWASESIWTKLKSKIFTDGITNKLIGYFLTDPRDIVIFKIYGARTENMIDRPAEINTMKFLNNRKLGPELYGVFDNGIVYEFIPGITLNPISCRDNKIYPLVAEKMAILHSIPMDEVPSTNKEAFWDKLNIFLKLANEILDNNATISQKYANFGLDKRWTNNNVTFMRELVRNTPMCYAFCHNDILLPNIIYDEVTTTVSFIDYEYAFINYAAFDVANHFNEFAGVDNADFSLCPDPEFMKIWIQKYLKYWKNGKSGISVDEFQNWVNLCIHLSHLFWILWTIVQAQNSTIEFDYVTYAEKRFLEYERHITSYRKYSK